MQQQYMGAYLTSHREASSIASIIASTSLLELLVKSSSWNAVACQAPACPHDHSQWYHSHCLASRLERAALCHSPQACRCTPYIRLLCTSGGRWNLSALHGAIGFPLAKDQVPWRATSQKYEQQPTLAGKVCIGMGATAFWISHGSAVW